MKKFLFLLALLLSCNMYAQYGADWYHVDGSCVFRAGYNFAENAPFGAVAVIAETGFLRAQMEVGGIGVRSGLDRLAFFPYVAPLVGFASSGRHVFYALVGAMPLGALYNQDGTTEVINPLWHVRFDAGVDFRLTDMLYLNIGGIYLLPRKTASPEHSFKNASLTVGLGLRL